MAGLHCDYPDRFAGRIHIAFTECQELRNPHPGLPQQAHGQVLQDLAGESARIYITSAEVIYFGSCRSPTIPVCSLLPIGNGRLLIKRPSLSVSAFYSHCGNFYNEFRRILRGVFGFFGRDLFPISPILETMA